MSEQQKRNVKLGLFIFIGLTFFIVGILAIGNINKTFTKTIEIYSSFDEVNGLQPGDNIWFSGLKVGTVKDLQFLENAWVRVIMKIETKSQQFIPKDAKAKISSDGLIGNKIIVIYGGSIKTGHIEEGNELAFETSKSTEDMIKMLQENNENLLAITSSFKKISEQIASGEGSVGKLLTDETAYDKINATLTTLHHASQQVDQLTSQVNELTQKFNTPGNLASDLASDTMIYHNLQRSVADINRVTQTAITIADDLKQTTNTINTDTDSPIGVLINDEKAGESLKSSISNLEMSTAKLNESMTALQNSFLLRGFFKRQEKQKDEGAETK